jgi:hypothetical protein
MDDELTTFQGQKTGEKVVEDDDDENDDETKGSCCTFFFLLASPFLAQANGDDRVSNARVNMSSQEHDLASVYQTIPTLS